MGMRRATVLPALLAALLLLLLHGPAACSGRMIPTNRDLFLLDYGMARAMTLDLDSDELLIMTDTGGYSPQETGNPLLAMLRVSASPEYYFGRSDHGESPMKLLSAARIPETFPGHTGTGDIFEAAYFGRESMVFEQDGAPDMFVSSLWPYCASYGSSVCQQLTSTDTGNMFEVRGGKNEQELDFTLFNPYNVPAVYLNRFARVPGLSRIAVAGFVNAPVQNSRYVHLVDVTTLAHSPQYSVGGAAQPVGSAWASEQDGITSIVMTDIILPGKYPRYGGLAAQRNAGETVLYSFQCTLTGGSFNDYSCSAGSFPLISPVPVLADHNYEILDMEFFGPEPDYVYALAVNNTASTELARRTRWANAQYLRVLFAPNATAPASSVLEVVDVVSARPQDNVYSLVYDHDGGRLFALCAQGLVYTQRAGGGYEGFATAAVLQLDPKTFNVIDELSLLPLLQPISTSERALDSTFILPAAMTFDARPQKGSRFTTAYVAVQLVGVEANTAVLKLRLGEEPRADRFTAGDAIGLVIAVGVGSALLMYVGFGVGNAAQVSEPKTRQGSTSSLFCIVDTLQSGVLLWAHTLTPLPKWYFDYASKLAWLNFNLPLGFAPFEAGSAEANGVGGILPGAGARQLLSVPMYSESTNTSPRSLFLANVFVYAMVLFALVALAAVARLGLRLARNVKKVEPHYQDHVASLKRRLVNASLRVTQIAYFSLALVTAYELSLVLVTGYPASIDRLSSACAWTALFAFVVAFPGMNVAILGWGARGRVRYTDPVFRQTFGCLFDDFRQDRYMFNLVVLARKLMLGAIVGVMAVTGEVYRQIAALIAVRLVYLYLLYWQRPFVSDTHHSLEMLGNALGVALMGISFVLIAVADVDENGFATPTTSVTALVAGAVSVQVLVFLIQTSVFLVETFPNLRKIQIALRNKLFCWCCPYKGWDGITDFTEEERAARLGRWKEARITNTFVPRAEAGNASGYRAVYVVTVRDEGSTWTVQRTFDDFASYKAQLDTLYTLVRFRGDFPTKALMGSPSTRALEKHSRMYDRFLDYVLLTPDLSAAPETHAFLLKGRESPFLDALLAPVSSAMANVAEFGRNLTKPAPSAGVDDGLTLSPPSPPSYDQALLPASPPSSSRRGRGAARARGGKSGPGRAAPALQLPGSDLATPQGSFNSKRGGRGGRSPAGSMQKNSLGRRAGAAPPGGLATPSGSMQRTSAGRRSPAGSSHDPQAGQRNQGRLAPGPGAPPRRPSDQRL